MYRLGRCFMIVLNCQWLKTIALGMTGNAEKKHYPTFKHQHSRLPDDGANFRASPEIVPLPARYFRPRTSIHRCATDLGEQGRSRSGIRVVGQHGQRLPLPATENNGELAKHSWAAKPAAVRLCCIFLLRSLTTWRLRSREKYTCTVLQPTFFG
jgi:hypothetical protein